MQKLFRGVALGASVLAFAAAAPAAMASGGRAAGGGATAGGGGGGTAAPTGGGSGGGGGSARGGLNDAPAAPAPPAPPPVTPCATLSALSAPVGYYLTFAAVWNDFTVRSCATGTDTVSVTVRNVNVDTGQTEYTWSGSYSLLAGQNTSSVIDNDFAPFDTNYEVQIEVRDRSGNLLDSQSVQATTPPPR